MSSYTIEKNKANLIGGVIIFVVFLFLLCYSVYEAIIDKPSFARIVVFFLPLPSITNSLISQIKDINGRVIIDTNGLTLHKYEKGENKLVKCPWGEVVQMYYSLGRENEKLVIEKKNDDYLFLGRADYNNLFGTEFIKKANEYAGRPVFHDPHIWLVDNEKWVTYEDWRKKYLRRIFN